MDSPAPTRTARPPLTRARVVEAALELIDEDGLEQLSMRRLAGRLGVEAMSLYNHVSDKSDLLRGVADAVLTSMVAPTPELVPDHDDWRARVRWVLHELRRACVAHPDAVPLVVDGGFTTPAAFGPVDELLGALDDAGLDAEDRVRAMRTLISFAIGTISCEIAEMRQQARAAVAADGGSEGSTDVPLPAVDPALGHLLAVGDAMWCCDFDGDYAVGIEQLLSAIVT
jgi:AcrR family transcriptional regulator